MGWTYEEHIASTELATDEVRNQQEMAMRLAACALLSGAIHDLADAAISPEERQVLESLERKLSSLQSMAGDSEIEKDFLSDSLEKTLGSGTQ